MVEDGWVRSGMGGGQQAGSGGVLLGKWSDLCLRTVAPLLGPSELYKALS